MEAPGYYSYATPSPARSNKRSSALGVWIFGGIGIVVLVAIIVLAGSAIIGTHRTVANIKKDLEKSEASSSDSNGLSAAKNGGAMASSSSKTNAFSSDRSLQTSNPSLFGLDASLSSSIATNPGSHMPRRNLNPVAPLPPNTVDIHTGASVYLLIDQDPNNSDAQTKMRIYVPSGDHPPKSLACIFIAPAHTAFLNGQDIAPRDNMLELGPFIQAGMMVVVYSISGPMDEEEEVDREIFLSRLAASFQKFAASNGGVDNGKVAINRVLSSFPAVDPGKLYAYEFLAAGTTSLLLASQDDRISKVVAFDPTLNLEEQFKEGATKSLFISRLPGFNDYLIKGSPITYKDRIKAEILIIHAADDVKGSFDSSREYVQAVGGNSRALISPISLRDAVTFMKVSISNSIQWLRGE